MPQTLFPEADRCQSLPEGSEALVGLVLEMLVGLVVVAGVAKLKSKVRSWEVVGGLNGENGDLCSRIKVVSPTANRSKTSPETRLAAISDL